MELFNLILGVLSFFQFLMVFYIFISSRRSIKLNRYVSLLPEDLKDSSFRISDLELEQAIKSACSSRGLKVNLKNKKFEVTGKF